MKKFDYLNYIKDNPLLKELEADDTTDQKMQRIKDPEIVEEILEVLGMAKDSCVNNMYMLSTGDEAYITFVIHVLQNPLCPENYISTYYDMDQLIRRANGTKAMMSLFNREIDISDAKPNNGGGITWTIKYKS